MRLKPTEDVEALLDRELRAGLPFACQVLLYLHPFALFKNAATGSLPLRERARSYNRAMRWMLLPYLRRWSAIAASLFAALIPTEALATQASFFIVPAAAFAVGCCVALTVAACTAATYFLLSAPRD